MDRLSDYDYHLPEELIAQTPLEDRAASWLLHLDRTSGTVTHRMFRDVPTILEPGDLLVLNNTRVSAVRVFGHKPTGGKVEALLLREVQDGLFEALVKPGRSLRDGSAFELADLPCRMVGDGDDGVRQIQFELIPGFREHLVSQGSVPLPPYIHERLADAERYQTVYSHSIGSAAAPTAGLHFTPIILDCVKERGIQVAEVTLHVGIDTFRPVQVENLDDHRMHGEWCSLSEETARAIRSVRGRIVAVGTTTVRTLESFATGQRQVRSGQMVSSLFIRPGFQFQVIDGMFTNFHLPQTTMLTMISALASPEAIRSAYQEAIHEKYRFLSFGDSMLIL